MHYLDSIGYTVVCFHGKFSSQGLRSGPFLAVPFQSLLESALPLASSKPASTRPLSKATSANLLGEVKGNLYQPTAKSSLPQDLKANLVSSKSGRRRTKSATEPVDIPVKGSSKSQKDVTGSYGSGGARSGISTGSSRTNSLVIKPSNSSLKPEKVLTKKNAENEGSRKSLSDSEERRPKSTASPKKKKNKEDTKQVKEQRSSSRSADRRSEFFVSGIEDTCLSTDSESDYCRS